MAAGRGRVAMATAVTVSAWPAEEAGSPPAENRPKSAPPFLARRRIIDSLSNDMPSVDPSVPPRVLVVEDERKTRDSVVEGLRLEAWKVAAATNGSEAISLLDHDPFDLVVLDW